MARSVTTSVQRLGYERLRTLIFIAGLAILLVVAGVSYVRRVETVEVWATVLFMLVFIGFFFGRVWGGLVAALIASGIYIALRYPAIDAVGFDTYAGLVASRVVAYLAFGLIGGWSIKQLGGSLQKLELYDEIDDATGLHNARFFLSTTEVERSRADRYRTIFSIAAVAIPASVLSQLSTRKRRRILRDLGRLLRASVRTVDRPVYASDGKLHHLAVILPETASDGARVFVDRLADALVSHLRSQRVTVATEDIERTVATYPGDDTALGDLRETMAEIDRAQHPSHEEADAG